MKEMTQSFEDHLTAPSEETEENQRSKLLSKMSRLGGQAILPPGTMPTHHVSQGVWSQWAWYLWVWLVWYSCRWRLKSSQQPQLLPSLE